MAHVRIENLSKSYTPGVPVLTDFSLRIESGELFFLLGPSGCGKSTLLRILAGLVTPDCGKIFFGDTDIGKLPPEKRRAAMVFQNYALWPHMDVFENVAFGLRTAGVSGAELKKRVMEALETVRLADYARRRVPSLSGGQQQRVALARALAVEPLLLLLDEPLSNLDARLRDTMRGEIQRICKERHLTALYVTHDRQEALSMADRLAVLRNGVICQLGTPEEVYNYPSSPFCAEFLGDVNFFPATVEKGKLSCAFGSFPHSGTMTGNVRGAIRPERLRFVDPAAPGAFPVQITGRTFLGESCDWKCLASGVELLVRESAPPLRRTGEGAFLAWDKDYLLTFEAQA